MVVRTTCPHGEDRLSEWQFVAGASSAMIDKRPVRKAAPTWTAEPIATSNSTQLDCGRVDDGHEAPFRVLRCLPQVIL